MGPHQKNLDKSIHYPRSPSPCQEGRNHLDLMPKKTKPQYKNPNKLIASPKTPSPCLRGLNHLYVCEESPMPQKAKGSCYVQRPSLNGKPMHSLGEKTFVS